MATCDFPFEDVPLPEEPFPILFEEVILHVPPSSLQEVNKGKEDSEQARCLHVTHPEDSHKKESTPERMVVST